MTQHLTPHEHAIITWVLIADAKEAQIYASHHVMQKTTVGGANVHHLYNEKSGHELIQVEGGHLKAPSDQLNHGFTKSISDKLHAAHAQKQFNNLVLVAPPNMLGELRNVLAKDVLTAVVAELPKELSHYHGLELMTHLHDTLVKAHAA